MNATPLRIRGKDPDERFISFIGPNGEIGWLDWKDGQLIFSGNMAESARIFLNCLEPLAEATVRALLEDKLCKHQP